MHTNISGIMAFSSEVFPLSKLNVTLVGKRTQRTEKPCFLIFKALDKATKDNPNLPARNNFNPVGFIILKVHHEDLGRHSTCNLLCFQ
jgi:hypothetical protein